MPYSSAALEDESLPPPEASPAGQSGSRGVTVPDNDAPAGSEKNDPGPAPFHQHPRPEGFHIFPQEKGLPPTPPIDEPRSTGVWQRQPESDEPYIPSAKRPYEQWGTPDFSRGGPYMPQPRDIPRLIHNVVMGLGRYGSHYSGMPAIAMGTYANAYWQAYQKGMKERAADNWQKYREARQMTLDRTREEILKAKEGIALYGNNPDKLRQYYQQMVSDYHDQQLANALAINPAAVDALWAARDTHWHDLAKQKAAEEKAKQEQKERDLRIRTMERNLNKPDPNALPPSWGGKPGASAAPDTTQPDETDGAGTAGETDGTGDTESTDGDSDQSSAEPAKPTQLAELGTSDVPSLPSSGQPSPKPAPVHVATPEEVERRIDDMARGELRGEAVDKGVPKQILPRIAARKADLERELNAIADSGAKGQDMLNRLRAFDPEIANTVEDITHGVRAVPGGGGFGAATAAGWNRLTSLAKAVRPDWGPEIATYRREFTNANGAQHKTLLAAAGLVGAAEKVLSALQYIPESGPGATPPANWFNQLVAGKITGSPEWNRLGSALNSYAEESAKLARGGQSAEGDIRRVLEKYATITAGPKTIRSLLSNEAGIAVTQIQSRIDDWQSTTAEKTLPPGYNDGAMKSLQAIDNINMMTGRVKEGTFVPKNLEPLLGPAGTRRGELSSSAGKSSEPAVGEIRYGYKFKGGNWRDQNNWEKQ